MFDYRVVTAESLRSDAEETLAACDALVDEMVAVDAPRTWANTAEPMLEVQRLQAGLYGRVPFMSQAHPDADVRTAARELEEHISQWGIALTYRRDVYEAFAAHAENPSEDLTDEQRRWLEFELRDLVLAGHGLDAEARDELERTNTRLSELALTYASNVNENEDHLDVPIEDLAGLPEPLIAGLGDGDEPGTKRVTMDYPDVVPALQMVKSRTVRTELSRVFNSRCAVENRAILEEAIRLRMRVAELFGLDSWTDYRLQTRMAGGSAAVQAMYDRLVPPLTEKAHVEAAAMEALLVADGESAPLTRADYSYYEDQLRQSDFGVDQHAVSQYFELERTMQGLLDLTSEVFGLTYRKVEDPPAWHADVTLYEVHDADTERLIGHFYADLFPREGKFGHAAAFPVHVAHDTAEGRQTPVTAFLCNFPKSTDDQPSLLMHTDVVTLFHEFGHVLHMTLSKASMPRFSGASTEWDFVEAPSQIMEHWCWTPEVLARFAFHHETGEPIPTELVDQLTAAKNLNIALFTLRQIALGKIDQGFHGVSEMPDLDAVVAEADDISLLPGVEGTFMPASFGHLMGGYDAAYYGYLWAKVFGDDMFSVFAEEGVTNPEVGTRYRTKVLEPNATKDAIDLLRDFLGREPNDKAFLTDIGLD